MPGLAQFGAWLTVQALPEGTSKVNELSGRMGTSPALFSETEAETVTWTGHLGAAAAS
jgi:hypothetical protein